jgi:beta-glucosidase
MSIVKFPNDFIWGVAASAYQIEGGWNEDGKGPSIWDTFSHIPGKVKNNENGDVAIDHYHRYKDDMALMADIGIPAYRFSVAWTRILPNGKGAVNQVGLDLYDRLVDELLKHKIEPYACLFHYDLPQALQDKGGWPNRDTAYAFADYAHVVTERLSDRVKIWITHNEPWVTAMVGYGFGEHAPGKRNPVAMFKAMHHVFLSHGLAAEAIRASAKQPVKVGITLNLNPVHPATGSKKDAESALRVDAMLNRIQLDPLLKRTSPLQEFSFGRWIARDLIRPGDLEKISNLDLLGVNYYSRTVVKHAPWIPFLSTTIIEPKGNEYSEMWEIYPEGIYEILARVWKDYFVTSPQPLSSQSIPEGSKERSLPEIMVTENGIPVPDELTSEDHIHDPRRIRYLTDHLVQVRRAMDEGVPVKGYFHWSFCDNFEWAHGYAKRFGLVYVDYATQKRTVKDSGHWFAQVIRENGFQI